MRILHIAWEYPPLVYGGLGRHVGSLATAQAAAGHEVVVITQAESEPVDEVVDGVRVLRVLRDLPKLEFTEASLLAWVASLETAFIRAAIALSHQWRPEVVHGHDWMIAHALLAAGELFDRPVVTTIHATEAGRHQGWLSSDLSRAIHSVEWWLAQQSTQVIACSAHMRWEVQRLFDIPKSRISIVPNGIDMHVWRTTASARQRAREQFAPNSPLVVFCGRLEWEKGVHTLLEAMPALRDRYRGIRLVIAGKGGKSDDLRRQTRQLHLSNVVRFTGWIPETELHALVACADVVVVPSLYEPFGLVALEAAALGSAVVVAESGGLAEFAANGKVALTFPPGDAEALAATVSEVLDHPADAAARAAVATHTLEDNYTWQTVATQTDRVYGLAASIWDATAPGQRGSDLSRVSALPLEIPTGNLLLPH